MSDEIRRDDYTSARLTITVKDAQIFLMGEVLCRLGIDPTDSASLAEWECGHGMKLAEHCADCEEVL